MRNAEAISRPMISTFWMFAASSWPGSAMLHTLSAKTRRRPRTIEFRAHWSNSSMSDAEAIGRLVLRTSIHRTRIPSATMLHAFSSSAFWLSSAAGFFTSRTSSSMLQAFTSRPARIFFAIGLRAESLDSSMANTKAIGCPMISAFWMLTRSSWSRSSVFRTQSTRATGPFGAVGCFTPWTNPAMLQTVSSRTLWIFRTTRRRAQRSSATMTNAYALLSHHVIAPIDSARIPSTAML